MLAPVIQKADSAGLQCPLLAIGDATIRNAIDVLERLATPRRRHRTKHLELTSPGDAERPGRIEITASIQDVHSDPATLRAWPCEMGVCLQGSPGWRRNVLALRSDAPTVPHARLPNLCCAATRRSAREPESQATTNEQHVRPPVTAMDLRLISLWLIRVGL